MIFATELAQQLFKQQLLFISSLQLITFATEIAKAMLYKTTIYLLHTRIYNICN